MDSISWPIVAPMAVGAAIARGQPFYFAPFVVYRPLPAGVVRAKWLAEIQDTESIERRVMICPSSDGLAYSQNDFVQYFGSTIGQREWERAAPARTALAPWATRRSAPDLGRGVVEADRDESNDTFFMDM